MSTSDSPCIPANPDIVGIGVRVAIYAQNLLSFVPAIYAILDNKVTPTELDQLEAQSSSIVITAFAILASAAIQARTGGITSYHGAIVLNLSWINNTNLFIYFLLYAYHKTTDQHQSNTPMPTSRKRRLFRFEMKKNALKNPVFLIGSAHLTLMAAIGIWLWSQPADFGIPKTCSLSSSIFIVGRRVTLGTAQLRAWSILVYTLLLTPILNLIIPVGFFVAPAWLYRRAVFGTSDLGIDMWSTRIGLGVLATIDIIFLVDTELAIRWNESALQRGDADWTFGQTLALLLLLVPMRDIGEMVLERRAKRLGKKVLDASTNGQLDVVRDAIRSGASADTMDPSLKIALTNHHFEVAEFLIKNGASRNAIGHAFMAAAENGNLKLVKLLRSETPADTIDPSLKIALTNQHFEVAEFLIENSASRNVIGPAFMTAAKNGNLNLVKLLIAKGAEMYEKDLNGRYAIYYAAKGKHGSVVKYLLGLEKEPRNQTILYLAAKKQYTDVDVLETLIDNGMDINEKDGDGCTVFDYAVKQGEEDIMRLLMKHGANVKTKDIKGVTALHLAAEGGKVGVVRFLIENGADVNAKDRYNTTVLHFAAKGGNLDIFRFLVEHGVDVNAKDRYNMTVLHFAAKGENLDVLRLLVKYGLDVNAKNSYDMTVLHSAVDGGNLDIIRFLVKHGADVNAKDRYNMTVLHFAAVGGNLDIVRFLVEHGADVNVKDCYNATVLHFAKKSRNLDVVQFLVEHGADVNATV